MILDVLMPGMTGPELAGRFAELRVPAKVLFVSGFAPESFPTNGSPAQDTREMLQKPFTAVELLNRVRTLLDACA